jgi:predicted ATPase
MVRSNLPTSLFPSPWNDESAMIQQLLLEEPNCRLVTLVGPGCICKTWLAWQVTMRVRDAFADGVRAIRLVAAQSSDHLARLVAGGLDFYPPALVDTEEHLIKYLRGKEMLLTLDALEGLVEGADLIEDILLSAPRVKLLVASRARLGLRQEWVRQIRWENAPFARERGERLELVPTGRRLAWGQAYARADDGWTGDGGASRQRTTPEEFDQASQMASIAGQ